MIEGVRFVQVIRKMECLDSQESHGLNRLNVWNTTEVVDNESLVPYKKISSTVFLSGRNSAVECQLPKLDVTGSIPVARSKIP